MRYLVSHLAIVSLLCTAACVTLSDPDSESEEDIVAQMPGIPDPGNPAGPSCEASTTDGTSACGDVWCVADAHCALHGLCQTGCMTDANCGFGDYCDRRSAEYDHDAGVCQPCVATPAPPDEPGEPAPGACDGVQGNYTVMPASTNPAQCSEIFPLSPGSTCSVTASGATLGISCAIFDGLVPLPSCSIDSSSCSCSVVDPSGVTWVYDFASGYVSLSFPGLLCEYNIFPG